MRRFLVPLAALFAFGCENAEHTAEIYNSPQTCEPEFARNVGREVAENILIRLENEETRLVACNDIDEIIRFPTSTDIFDAAKPDDCEWAWSEEEKPFKGFSEVMEPKGDTLAVLCDWPGRQSEARRRNFEDQGRTILNDLPTDEREQIEREWQARQ
jgi:hypothetical protein